MDVIGHVSGTRRMVWSVQFIRKYQTTDMKTSVRRRLESQHPEPQEPEISISPPRITWGHRLGALAIDRTSCACAAQITEHGFTEARRLRQRPADRKECRLSQVEEGQPGIVPRLPNW